MAEVCLCGFPPIEQKTLDGWGTPPKFHCASGWYFPVDRLLDYPLGQSQFGSHEVLSAKGSM
jgi:hypothetical protein